MSDLVTFAREIATDTKAFVERKVAQAVAPLEARIQKLAQRPAGIKYVGGWVQGREYQAGDCVSRKGLWIAMCATRAKPGESADWRLAVRDGRDGKDLR